MSVEIVQRAIAYRILTSAYFHMPYDEAASKMMLDARTQVVREMSWQEHVEVLTLDGLTRD